VQIQLNGETREFADNLTIENLLAALELEPARVAIELNRDVVRRPDWAGTVLRDGDRVEIVHFVGGGGEQGSEVRGQRAGFPLRVVSCDFVDHS
jgi:sulfur carrier protein